MPHICPICKFDCECGGDNKTDTNRGEYNLCYCCQGFEGGGGSDDEQDVAEAFTAEKLLKGDKFLLRTVYGSIFHIEAWPKNCGTYYVFTEAGPYIPIHYIEVDSFTVQVAAMGSLFLVKTKFLSCIPYDPVLYEKMLSDGEWKKLEGR